MWCPLTLIKTIKSFLPYTFMTLNFASVIGTLGSSFPEVLRYVANVRLQEPTLTACSLPVTWSFARKIAIYMASRAKIGFSMKRTNFSKVYYNVFKTLLKCSFLTSASFQLVVWRIGSSWDYLSNHSLCDGQKLVPTLTSDFILSLSSSVFFHSSLYFRICILSP